MPAHHYSNGFDPDAHGLDSIVCSKDTRGMMFYDVSGGEDGVCVCACKSGDVTYAWFVRWLVGWLVCFLVGYSVVCCDVHTLSLIHI